MTKDPSGTTGYCQIQLCADFPGETKQMTTKARTCFPQVLREALEAVSKQERRDIKRKRPMFCFGQVLNDKALEGRRLELNL